MLLSGGVLHACLGTILPNTLVDYGLNRAFTLYNRHWNPSRNPLQALYRIATIVPPRIRRDLKQERNVTIVGPTTLTA